MAWRTDKSLFRYSPQIGELLGEWMDSRNTGQRTSDTLDQFIDDAKKKHGLPDSAAETLRNRINTFEACLPPISPQR